MGKIFRAYADLGHAFATALRAPRVQALLFVAMLIAVAGAAVYCALEGWSFVDALYFAVVSMATVGYGDLAPESRAGRLFTILFLMVGIGIFVLAVSAFAEAVIRALRKEKPEE